MRLLEEEGRGGQGAEKSPLKLIAPMMSAPMKTRSRSALRYRCSGVVLPLYMAPGLRQRLGDEEDGAVRHDREVDGEDDEDAARAT